MERCPDAPPPGDDSRAAGRGGTIQAQTEDTSVPGGPYRIGTMALAERLDALGVAASLPRRAQHDALRAAGLRVSTARLADAVRYRKHRDGLPVPKPPKRGPGSVLLYRVSWRYPDWHPSWPPTSRVYLTERGALRRVAAVKEGGGTWQVEKASRVITWQALAAP